MREGWSIRSLGDVATIYNGNSINAEEKKKKYLGQTQGLPFIATKDVSNNGSIDYENGVRIPNYTDFKIARPDSVFVCAEGGSAGKKVAFVEQEVCFGNKLFALQPKKALLNGKYLYYYVQSQSFKEQFKQLITGIIGGVSSKKIKEISIILSSLPEQQRIVDILDREFAKIDALKVNAEKSLQAAKDLFQATMKKELKPKEGWTQETLFAVSTEMFAGGDAPKNQMTDTPSKEYPIPIIANAVENEGLYGYTSIARVSVPSITIAGRGSGTGYVFRRRYSFFPIVRLIVIIPNDNKVCLDYLYFAIKSLNIQSSGSAIPQLTIPMIKNYLIAYPAKSIQEVIVKRLTQMEEGYFQLKENYQKTLTLCDDLKQSLLRKAFNGEL